MPHRSARRTRLIPLRLRPAATIAAVSMGVLTLVMSLVYRHRALPGRVDEQIASAITRQFNAGSQISWIIVRLGDPVPIVTMAVGLATVSLLFRMPRASVLALAGTGAACATTQLMKPLVGRTDHGDFTFPSGHTTGITAIATIVAVIVISLGRNRLIVSSLVAISVVVASGALMSISLLSRHLHYPTDTLGGFLTAIVVVLAVALCIDAAPRKDGCN
jgi:membrane-associated phospholipid phosphatase